MSFDKLAHLKNYIEKEVGLKPKMEATNTTDYSYSAHLPKPCDHIKENKNTGIWECCLSTKDPNFNKEDDNYTRCIECRGNERNKGICNYVWDHNFYNNNPSVEVKNSDSEDTKKNKMKIWFKQMLNTYDSIKGENAGYEDILFGMPKNQLGSRYFYKNGLKCKNKLGIKVDAYNYSNNIMPKGLNLTNGMLNDLSDFSIDDIINSHAVNNKGKTGNKGGGLSREYNCKMVTKPVGLYVDSISKCKSGPNILSDTKCILETKPIIDGLSKIDRLDDDTEKAVNFLSDAKKNKNRLEHFQNYNIKNVNDINNNLKDNTETNDYIKYSLISENCNCNVQIYLFLILVFFGLLLLNYFIF